MAVFELLISFALVVLIWIIQILHYPSFRFIEKEIFPSFEQFHTKRISYIVIPLMLSELFLSIIDPKPFVLSLLILIWGSTFFIQVPCHEKLKNGFDENVISRLIFTNWIRTILWTIKFIFLLSTTYGHLVKVT